MVWLLVCALGLAGETCLIIALGRHVTGPYEAQALETDPLVAPPGFAIQRRGATRSPPTLAGAADTSS